MSCNIVDVDKRRGVKTMDAEVLWTMAGLGKGRGMGFAGFYGRKRKKSVPAESGEHSVLCFQDKA